MSSPEQKAKNLVYYRRSNLRKTLKKSVDLDGDLTFTHNLIMTQVKEFSNIVAERKMLDEKELQALINCMKILNNLRVAEDSYVAKLTPEERKALADDSKKKA